VRYAIERKNVLRSVDLQLQIVICQLNE